MSQPLLLNLELPRLTLCVRLSKETSEKNCVPPALYYKSMRTISLPSVKDLKVPMVESMPASLPKSSKPSRRPYDRSRISRRIQQAILHSWKRKLPQKRKLIDRRM